MFYRAVSLLSCLFACSLSLAAESSEPNLQAANLASITGVVTTRDGRPVSDARVEAVDPSTGDLVASAYSRRNGSFQMEDVPLGSYEVHAKSGFFETRATVLLKSAGNAAAAMVRLLFPRDFRSSQRRKEETATISVTRLQHSGKIGKQIRKIRQALHENKNDEAGKHIDAAMRIDANNGEVLTFAGLLKMRRDENEAALEYLDRAAKIDPYFSLTYLGLGALFNRTSHYADAERALERAATLDPASWQAYFEMAKTMVGKGEYSRAVTYADRARALAPADFAPIHLVRANALMALKDFREAATELQAYVDRDDSSVAVQRAKVMLSHIRAKLQRPENAELQAAE